MSQRRKRVTDLFVRGVEVPLPDGTYLWVQALNSFERDEALLAAQVARSRLVLALKKSGDERVRIEGLFAELGRAKFANDLAEVKSAMKRSDLVAELEDDPDWAERTRILFETDLAQAAKPAEPSEQELMISLSEEWFAELARRLDSEKEFLLNQYKQMSDEEMLDEYYEYWTEQRGGGLAQAEYSLVEVWKSAKLCEATVRDGVFDHSACNGHQVPLFESKVEARNAPDALMDLIGEALKGLSMSVRDPKGSANPPSSSESSPPASGPAEEAPSISTETPESPPGTSVQQLVTL